MTEGEVAARLRVTAALRALCLRLPHLSTPAESARLRRFEVLAAWPEAARDVDADALAAGWRRWWREGETARLRAMAARLPPGLLAGDRTLAGYACAAGLDP